MRRQNEALVERRRAAGERSSQYNGVSWQKATRKWQAHIAVGGKAKGLGLFHNEEEAARAYDAEARLHLTRHHLLNFPVTAEEQSAVAATNAAKTTDEAVIQANEALVERRRAAGERSSQYNGVTWQKAARRWVAQITVRGQSNKGLGTFYNEVEAARAFDAEARLHPERRHLVNFPATEEQSAAAAGNVAKAEQVVEAAEALVEQAEAEVESVVQGVVETVAAQHAERQGETELSVLAEVAQRCPYCCGPPGGCPCAGTHQYSNQPSNEEEPGEEKEQDVEEEHAGAGAAEHSAIPAAARMAAATPAVHEHGQAEQQGPEQEQEQEQEPEPEPEPEQQELQPGDPWNVCS